MNGCALHTLRAHRSAYCKCVRHFHLTLPSSLCLVSFLSNCGPMILLFFFFQAEDGIRDLTVTGVQTCALPICGLRRRMGVMTGDRFERLLREAAQDYHRPPETPREELWRRIAALREARRRRLAFITSPRLRWGVGIAAALALGVGIGRWTAHPPRASQPAVAAARGDEGALAYRVAAAQYLTRPEALLTGFRSEARSGVPDAQFARQARESFGAKPRQQGLGA